jgi:solute carrier family 25 protein 33/36
MGTFCGWRVGPLRLTGNLASRLSLKNILYIVLNRLGGMCGAIVTAPFDLVKTRLQSSTYHADRSQIPRFTFSSSSSSAIPTTTTTTTATTTATPNRLFYHFIDTGRIIR